MGILATLNRVDSIYKYIFLKVLEVTFDGAAVNRRLAKIHDLSAGLTFKVQNIHSHDGRELFFGSSPSNQNHSQLLVIEVPIPLGNCEFGIDFTVHFLIYFSTMGKRFLGTIWWHFMSRTKGRQQDFQWSPSSNMSTYTLPHFRRCVLTLPHKYICMYQYYVTCLLVLGTLLVVNDNSSCPQVLSDSVAKALPLTVGPEASETAQFASVFDKFVDILNVSNFTN